MKLSHKIKYILALTVFFFTLSTVNAASYVYLKNSAGQLVGKITYDQSFINKYVKVNSFCIYKNVTENVTCEYVDENSPLAQDPNATVKVVANPTDNSSIWGALGKVSNRLDGFIKSVTGTTPKPIVPVSDNTQQTIQTQPTITQPPQRTEITQTTPSSNQVVYQVIERAVPGPKGDKGDVGPAGPAGSSGSTGTSYPTISFGGSAQFNGSTNPNSAINGGDFTLGTVSGAGLASCNASTSKLLYNSTTKLFECGVATSTGGGTGTLSGIDVGANLSIATTATSATISISPNVSLTNSTITNSTSTNFFSSFISAASSVFTNSFISTLFGTSSNFITSNASTTNASTTNTQNLTVSASSTLGSTTISNATISGNLNTNNLNVGGVSLSSTTINNLNALSSATVTNALSTISKTSTNTITIGDSSSTVAVNNLVSNNGTFTNATTTNLNTTNLSAGSTTLGSTTVSNILGNILSFATAFINTLTAVSGNIQTLFGTTSNFATSNASTTNAITANFTTNNSNTTNSQNINASTIFATSSINGTTINSSTTNASTTNTNTLNSSTNNSNTTNSQTGNFTTVNATGTSYLTTTYSSTTNASTTNTQNLITTGSSTLASTTLTNFTAQAGNVSSLNSGSTTVTGTSAAGNFFTTGSSTLGSTTASNLSVTGSFATNILNAISGAFSSIFSSIGYFTTLYATTTNATTSNAITFNGLTGNIATVNSGTINSTNINATGTTQLTNLFASTTNASNTNTTNLSVDGVSLSSTTINNLNTLSSATVTNALSTISKSATNTITIGDSSSTVAVNNLVSNNGTFTNATTTNLNTTNLSAGSTTLGSTTVSNILGNILSFTTSYFQNLNVTGSSTIGSTTASNLSVTGSFATNILNAITSTITTLWGTSSNFATSNASTTNASTTNAITANFTTNNSNTLNSGTINSTNINATGTSNLTTLNSSTTNASTTNTQNLSVSGSSTLASTTVTNITSTGNIAGANLSVSGSSTLGSTTVSNILGNILSFTTSYFQNLNVTGSSTIGSTTASNLSVTGSFATNILNAITSTITTLWGTSSNFLTSNASTSNATTSNALTFNGGTGNINLLNARSASLTDIVATGTAYLTTTYSSTTNASTSNATNLSASNGTITNLSVTNFSTGLTNGYVWRGNSSGINEATSSLFISDKGLLGLGTLLPTSNISINQGTLTGGTQGGLTLNGTWNNAATIFKGIEVDITNTAAHSNSNLLNIALSGSSVFKINSSGNTTITGNLGVSGTSTHNSAIDLGSNKIVNLALPTNTTDAANKAYVDAFVQGILYKSPVLSISTTTIVSSSTGDRYIVGAGSSGTGCSLNAIAQNTGSGVWTCETPATGTSLFVDQGLDITYNFNGSSWVSLGATVNHANLIGLQGGQAGEYYHVNASQYSNLNSINSQLSQLLTTGTATQFVNLTLTGGLNISGSGGGATITNATFTNIIVTNNSSVTNSTSTNLFSVNNIFTNATATTLAVTNASITNASTTNFYAQIFTAAASAFTNLLGTYATFTNATSTAFFSTTSSSTNLFSSVANIGSLIAQVLFSPTGYFTTLYATTTNATTSNAITFNGMTGNIATVNGGTVNSTNINATGTSQLTTVVASTSNASTTNSENLLVSGSSTLASTTVSNITSTGNVAGANLAISGSSTIGSTTASNLSVTGSLATNILNAITSTIATLWGITANFATLNASTTNASTTNSQNLLVSGSSTLASTTVSNITSTGNIAGNTINGTNINTTNFVTTNATFTNATLTNLSITGTLTTTQPASFSATSTFSTTTAASSTITNLSSNNATINTLNSTNLSVSGSSTLGSTTVSNITSTGNIAGANLSISGSSTMASTTFTNILGNILAFATAYFTNLSVSGSSTLASTTISNATISGNLATNVLNAITAAFSTIFATTGNFTTLNASTTNASTSNALTFNGGTGNLNILNSGIGNFTTLYATGTSQLATILASTTNASTTNTLNLLVSGSSTLASTTVSNITSTGNIAGAALNISGTSSFATTTSASSTVTNLSANSAQINRLNNSFATLTNATATDFYTLRASITNATATNFASQNSSVTNSTSTNLFANLASNTLLYANFATIAEGLFSRLFATSGYFTNIYASTTNASTSNATNQITTNATFTNATTTNLNVSGSLNLSSLTSGSASGISVLATNNLGAVSTTSVTSIAAEGLLVYSAGTQSVSGSSNVYITDLTNVNKNDFGSASLSAGTFTVPTGKAGWYTMSCGFYIDSSENTCEIWLNSTTMIVRDLSTSNTNATTQRYLNAGDTIRIRGYNQNGGNPSTLYTFLSLARLNFNVYGNSGTSISPSFSVTRITSNQAIAPTTWTKVDWNSVNFDSNNNFSITNDRYTPTVAGKYLFTANIYNGPTQPNGVSIYKNGVLYQTNFDAAGNGADSSITSVLDMNGTTDYVEIFVYSSDGSIGTSNRTNFSGSRIDGGSGPWTQASSTFAYSAVSSLAIGTSTYQNANSLYIQNGLSLASSTPTGTTTNTLYAIGNTLYWNGAAVSSGTSSSGNQGYVNDVLSSRSLNTVYQNTTGAPLIVTASAYSTTNFLTINGFIGATNSPTTPVAVDTSGQAFFGASITFTVPAGYYYQVSPGQANPILMAWQESSITGAGGSGTGISPSFRATRNGVNQTVTASTNTKMDWTTEDFDTNNNFDLTTDRYTPTVAGKYLIVSNLNCANSVATCASFIFKNGVQVANSQADSGITQTHSVSTILDMNGTTDYVESYVYVGGGTTVDGFTGKTSFSGSRIDGGSGPWTQASSTFAYSAVSTLSIGTTTFNNANSLYLANGLSFASSTASTTTLSLYAEGSTLKWNGNSVITSAATSTTGYIPYFDSTSNMSGTSSIFISTAGNIGIGTTTPTYKTSISSALSQLFLDNPTGQYTSLDFGNAGGQKARLRYDNTATTFSLDTTNSSALTFGTNSIERARIDSSGNFILGGTTQFATGKANIVYNGAANNGLSLNDTAATNGNSFIALLSNGSIVGNITNNANTGVLYNTTSDRRIKENFSTTTVGLADLLQLKVYEYNFINDPSKKKQNGFVAQDVYKIFRDAVTTNGDDGEVALSASSSPWSVDYGRITPLLVSSIQDIANISGVFKKNLVTWLADAKNGIDKVVANTLQTQILCVGKNCVNEEQFGNMMKGAGVNGVNLDNLGNGTSSGSSTDTWIDGSNTSTTSTTTLPILPMSDIRENGVSTTTTQTPSGNSSGSVNTTPSSGESTGSGNSDTGTNSGGTPADQSSGNPSSGSSSNEVPPSIPVINF